MSSTDGSERPTDKKLHEGDKEVTHLCICINPLEATCVIEERRQGVSFGAIIRYFNILLREYLTRIGRDEGIILFGSIIPSEDFLSALDSAEKISVAELFVDKEVVGSGYLGFLEIDANTREDIIMTIKSKPKQTFTKRALKEAYLAMVTEGTQVRRIRLRGRDYNNMSIVIDSINAKKKDEVIVELTENGIVNSASFFQKMEESLEE